MFQLLGPTRRLCDGCSRRDLLAWGSLTALGISLPEALAARVRAAEARGDARDLAPRTAQAAILIYLFGGPSQLDTFDMKPLAPADFRGEFRPIATNVPGIEICEHFPLLARQADKFALVRSMNHGHPRHGYGLYYAFTGREHPRPDLDAPPTENDFPTVGSLISRLSERRGSFPPAVTLPRWNRFLDLPNDYAGETAGFLGHTFDPWLVKGEPGGTSFQVAGVELPRGISLDRLAQRHDLLAALDRQLAQLGQSEIADQQDALNRQAFELVTSEQARQAFDLGQESEALRDDYGRNPFGQGLLLARRLVEAGSRLVTVNWHDDGSDVKSPFWDTHKDNFVTLKERLIPPVDRGLAALLNDLAARGLLDSTLIVMMGEFGRTPRIGRVVMNAATNATGRDHWPHAYSVLVAGGGVRGGQVYGASDERAAYVVESPVGPADLVATVLAALGVDRTARVHDRQGRPHFACEGEPIRGLF
ncbi:MAG: DUF1501 domain-containing protein [Pirellulales bacterium]|nr:DUF1501 domain-containing protein [Pirellulales bacterium]